MKGNLPAVWTLAAVVGLNSLFGNFHGVLLPDDIDITDVDPADEIHGNLLIRYPQ